jgi:hypothetical protein
MAATVNKVCMQQLPEGGYYFRIHDSRIEEEDSEGNPILMRWNIPIVARYAIDNYNSPMDMRADGKLVVGYGRHPFIQILTRSELQEHIDLELERDRRWLIDFISLSANPEVTEAGFPLPDTLNRPVPLWSVESIRNLASDPDHEDEFVLYVDPVEWDIREVSLDNYEFQGGVY